MIILDRVCLLLDHHEVWVTLGLRELASNMSLGSPNTFYVINTFSTESKQQEVLAVIVVAVGDSGPQCDDRVEHFYLPPDFQHRNAEDMAGLFDIDLDHQRSRLL